MAVDTEVAVVKEKLEKLVSARPAVGEEAEEVAGIGTLPNFKLLIAAAVISLVVIGVTTLFFVLFRPLEEEATVALPTAPTPDDAPPVETPPVEEPTV